MSVICRRSSTCDWRWPYVELSNGIQLENSEVIAVRSLRDFDGTQGAKAKINTKVYLRHVCNGRLELVKPGQGNRIWTGILFEPHQPREGVDFDLIPGEKLRLASKQARTLINKILTPAEQLARTNREIGPNTQFAP